MLVISLVNGNRMLNTVDLNLFVVFDTIYTERNLTRAADRLSVTQPAVSNALARLRATMNDPLFVKTPNGMQPTALAESIADRVSGALQSLQAVAQQSAGFSPATSRRIFRISLIELHDSMILPRLMRVLQAEAPGIELQISRVARQDLPKALSQGTMEIASDIALSDNTNIISRTILEDHYVCAVRPDHPLAQRSITLEDYLLLTHLHVSSRPKGAGAVDVALQKLGRKRKIGLRLQSYISAAAAVENSDLAITVTDRWARALNLTALPLPVPVRPLEVRLYRHVRTDGDEAVAWLFDKIAECTG